MKVTAHTIFIYSWGNYLRIVRGDHHPPDVATKPRVYPNLKEALDGERKKRIVGALRRFPPDTQISRRLKVNDAPIQVRQHRTLAEAVRSKLFTHAQVGYDTKHQEVAHIFHRDPGKPRGFALARTGRVLVVRKLLKKYKRPAIRELDYEERKPKIVAGEKHVHR